MLQQWDSGLRDVSGALSRGSVSDPHPVLLSTGNLVVHAGALLEENTWMKQQDFLTSQLVCKRITVQLI